MVITLIYWLSLRIYWYFLFDPWPSIQIHILFWSFLIHSGSLRSNPSWTSFTFYCAYDLRGSQAICSCLRICWNRFSRPFFHWKVVEISTYWWQLHYCKDGLRWHSFLVFSYHFLLFTCNFILWGEFFWIVNVNCFSWPALSNSKYALWALYIIQSLLTIRSDGFRLVKTEVIHFLSSVDYGLINFLTKCGDKFISFVPCPCMF